MTTSHRERQKELGRFLRSRRERMPPRDSASGNPSRRRTPGLRREEVADAAGVGVSWYTWLEQGRDIRVSPSVLRRVAHALTLGADETHHVFRLAGVGMPETAPRVTEQVSPSIQRVLDSLDQVPAYVHNARWDRIAWNDAALCMMGDFSRDPPEERNTVWRTFLNPAVRAYTDDWERIARAVIAEFNGSVSQLFDDPWLVTFTRQLRDRSPEFREWSDQREVVTRHDTTTRILHPLVGALHLDRAIFQIPTDPTLSLVLFTPFDTCTTPDRLRRAVEAFRREKDSLRGT